MFSRCIRDFRVGEEREKGRDRQNGEEVNGETETRQRWRDRGWGRGRGRDRGKRENGSAGSVREKERERLPKHRIATLENWKEKGK